MAAAPISTASIPRPDRSSMRGDSRARVLKACVFATGLSGIVAEYVMATLAS